MTFQPQYPGGGSAKAASAATAYSMIMQAINAASVDGGYKIAEGQGVFPELAALLDPALEIGSATISEAFDNATDAYSLASSTVFRDLVNGNTYLEDLGRVSAELSQYYGGYDIANLEYVQVSDGIANAPTSFAVGPILSGDRAAIYYANGSDLYRQTLSIPGDIRSVYGAATSMDVSALGAQNNILGFDVSPDESRILVCDNTADDIFEYDLSTPGDLSTASVNASQGTGNVPRAVAYASDGMAVYYVDNASNVFVRFPLSTAYDFSTRGASSSATLPSPTSGGVWTSVRGISIKEGGTKAYFVFQSVTRLFVYNLSVATLTLDEVKDLSGLSPDLAGMGVGLWISDDDVKHLYTFSSSGFVQLQTPPSELQAPA